MSHRNRFVLWLDRDRHAPVEVGEIELHMTGWQGELYIDEDRWPCSLVHYADVAYFGPFRTPYLALLAIKREARRLGGEWLSERLRMT